MNRELKSALEWLFHRHNTMKALAESNKGYKSDFMQGIAEGERIAAEFYGEEIEKIRALLDGFMIEDVNLNGEEEVC